jgi:hypothetical protein
MTDKETIEMMQRCLHEIEMQRQQINLLTPRADAYEIVSIIARGLSPRQGGMVSEDIVWRLRKKIEELQPKPNPERES